MPATIITKEPFPLEVLDEALSREKSLRIKAGAIKSWIEIENNQKILYTEWNVIGEND